MSDNTTVVRLFNRNGYEIGSVETIAVRSWVLNGYGQTKFNISINDPMASEDKIQFGNFVFIEHPTLPSWGGHIEITRLWKNGYIEVTAYTQERFLRWRRGPQSKLLSGTAGSIFLQILEYANSQGDTMISPGNIFTGGKSTSETINFSELYKDINRIANRVNMDWDVVPEIDNDGRLHFFANWYESKGVTVSNFVYEDGVNIEAEETILSEDNDIINELTGYGEGATWDSRIYYTERNEESIAKYGLRQWGKEYPGVTNMETLQANVHEELLRRCNPKKKFSVTVIDKGDAFKYLKLGNVIKYKTTFAGFTGKQIGTEAKCRISGLSYEEDDNVVPVTIEGNDEEDIDG